MIRARAGHATSRSARQPIPILVMVATLAVAAIAAACISGESDGPRTTDPGTSATASAEASDAAAPTGSDEPTDLPSSSPAPTEAPIDTATPEPSGSLTTAAASCSGNDGNRTFFDNAAVSMGWPVYCAVLPDGWFLEAGSYRLANGGYLEVTYRGPGDVRLALVEGNTCEGADIETCAPRDTVIGPAAFGDREGELGRLGNGLVLDVDRGASPTWRATGLGLSEEAFRALCAALLRIEA